MSAVSSCALGLACGVVFFAGATFPVEARGADLSLWHSYRGAERLALEHAAADASRRSRGAYHLKLLAVPNDAFARKLAAAIPRGHGPDLFIFAHERVGEFVRAGRIAPVVTQPDAGAFVPGTLDALRFEGRLYGWPLAFKSLALYYRKDLVASPPRDTDALIAAAKARTDPRAGRFGLAYESGSIYHHAPWLHGHGGAMFEGGAPALGSAAFVASLAFARSLARDFAVVPPEPSSAIVAMLFSEGRAAFVINGPWFLGEIRAGVPFGVAPLPIVSSTGRAAAPFLTVEAVLRSAKARGPELAERAASDLAGPESSRIRALEGRQAVAYEGAWRDARVREDAVLGAFRAQAALALPMPNRPEMNTLWEPAAVALRSTLRGNASPESAAATAQRRAKHLLRPRPTAANHWPYTIAVGLFALAGAAWMLSRARARAREIRASGRAARYLAPMLAAVLLLVVLPAVMGVALAFFEHKGGEYTFVGLQNFQEILLGSEYGFGEAWNFYTTFLVTVLWTVLNVALHVTLGVLLALWLTRPWLRLRGVFRVLLILPWAVPSYITALLWKGMFNAQFGAVNEILAVLGIERVEWFASFWPAFGANLCTNVWLGFPFMMVVTLGALSSIPTDLYEAARVDGATAWQRFRFVTAPLLRPALAPAVVLGTVWTFNMFNVVWLVSGGEPDGLTDILVSEAYRWAFARGERYGYAAAYAVLIFFVLLVYALWTGRRRGPAWSVEPEAPASAQAGHA